MIDNLSYEKKYEIIEDKTFCESIINKQILKGYSILLLGIFIMSFGIALSVVSDLGTTPISSIPNVTKYAITLSLGMITIIFNALLVLIQIFILKSDFEKKNWLQVLVAVIFGYFIDFCLYILSDLIPRNYFQKWLICIISCFVMAIGVYLEVLANVLVLPGEGVCLAINKVTDIEFGKIKASFDTSNVIVGGALSLILYGEFKGIGLGTIFSGIVVGYIIILYKKCLSKLFNQQR